MTSTPPSPWATDPAAAPSSRQAPRRVADSPGPGERSRDGLLADEFDPLLAGTRRWVGSNRWVAITSIICTAIAVAIVIITVVMLQPGLPADPVPIEHR